MKKGDPAFILPGKKLDPWVPGSSMSSQMPDWSIVTIEAPFEGESALVRTTTGLTWYVNRRNLDVEAAKVFVDMCGALL